jgi:D-alanyl-D-alanine carboxypeptidase
LIRVMPEADGMKTGFVCNSGYNLLASATRNGRKLIAVVLGAPSGKGRADLAQLMLLEGFNQAPSETRPRLAQVNNLPLGALVPADMTSSVCKTKAPVTVASARELNGWGISFGNYDTAVTADMALRGRLIAAAGLDAPGNSGVIKMPDKAGFAAMVWNIDQPTSLQLCAQYRLEQAFCDVMPPQVLLQLAATAGPEVITRPAQEIEEGADMLVRAPPPAKRKKAKVR